MMYSSFLADANSTTLGITKPEVTIPSGRNVQTGSVVALLINIRTYDQTVASLTNLGKDNEDERRKFESETASLEGKIKVTGPLLKRVEMFGVFYA
jgi:hypothetical protein